jgi:PTH1 family peptidyl-tRNA hydrolase
MKYIVGLGNPGSEYTHTRHNIGYLILSHIQETCQFSDWKHHKYFSADISEGDIDGVSYTLVKPTTFMNLSGVTIEGLLKHGAQKEDIVVIHDELAYPFGTLRLAEEKSDAGHNGVASIIKVLGSFLRIRVGIHSCKPEGDELIELKNENRADFVLKEFRPDEKLKIPEISDRVLAVLKSFETEGIEKTMTEVNKRK